MRIGMGAGSDFGGTITGGNPIGPVPCCTAQQASSPSYSNTEDGSLRSNGYGSTCNPNCLDETTYDNSVINYIQGGTQTMLLVAAAVGVFVLVMAKK